MEQIGTIIKGIPVHQNGQDFLIGKASIAEILSYTRYTERLILAFDEEEKPIYNDAIQRKVESSRVNKIADFLINDSEATFPTNIVLGIPIQMICTQASTNGLIDICLDNRVIEQIKLAKAGNSNADVYITIIDGQHRIRGIEIAIEKLEYEIFKTNSDIAKSKLSNLLNMELAVSYFIDKSLEYQAMIFSTINRTQKRVSQDLVYSLFGLTTEDTPYKTALEVVLALNAHPKSPFYHRIKLYGGDYTRLSSPPLSQASMIKSIVSFICESLRAAEIDKYKARKELRKCSDKKYLPFRKFYAENKDSMISDCLFFYFNSVKKHFPDCWNYDGMTKPTNILQSTVGYEALMLLLLEILKKEQFDFFNKETFEPYISSLENIDFWNTDCYPMSTKGRKILYLTMCLAVYPNDDLSDSRRKELDKLRSAIIQ